MVGRPTGYACTKCRARRIKCDYGKPACQRCIKAGFQCPGYDSRFIPAVQKSKPISYEHADGTNQEGISPLALVIGSRAAQQVQLASAYFQSRFGLLHVRDRGFLPGPYRFFCSVFNAASTSRLLSNALQALSSNHFGRLSQDQATVHAFYISYGEALAMIRRQIFQLSEHQQHGSEVLGAIMILRLLDGHLPAHTGQPNWTTHIQGAQQYLATSSPSMFNATDTLTVDAMREFFVGRFWLGLVNRTLTDADASLFERYAPIIHGAADAHADSWFRLVPNYMMLPRLLGEADFVVCMHGVANCRAVNHLCRQLEELRLRDLGETADPDESSIDELVLDMAIEEQRFIAGTRIFATQYEFRNPKHNYYFIHERYIHLIVDCTLLRLRHAYPAVEGLSSRSIEEIELDARTLARQLCRSVYYISKSPLKEPSESIATILPLARSFFEDYGDHDQARWCQECHVANSARLDRLRAQGVANIRQTNFLGLSIATLGHYRGKTHDGKIGRP